MNYKVTASLHIACEAFTITTEISEDNVLDVLADGVLYNTQRAAASKAVKALGGGKRSEIPFTEKARQIVADALEELFEGASIETREYIKGGSAPEKKFAAARKMLANKKGCEQVVADFIGFDGDLFDQVTGDFANEFLVAVDAFQNGSTIPNA